MSPEPHTPVGKFSTFFGNNDTLSGTFIGEKLHGHVSFWFEEGGVFGVECKIGRYACDADEIDENFEVSFDGKNFFYSESDGDSYVFEVSIDNRSGKRTGGAYLATDWGWEAEDERYAFTHEGTEVYAEFTNIYQVYPVPLPLSAPLLLGSAVCFPLLRIPGRCKVATTKRTGSEATG